jgi:alpha,alpha-trehalose phosphorylase
MAKRPSGQENWRIVEKDFYLNDVSLYETLFSLGNGYLGMRGTFEEGLGKTALEGTYINGFYESAPIIYGEKFIGFAENKQTILNLANAKVIRLWVGDEEFNMLTGKLLAYRRELDLRQGILHRSLRWQSPQGKQVMIEVDRLILHTHRHVALIRYQLTPLNFDGPIKLFSGIDGAVRQSEHAEGDPRLGTQFEGDVLLLEEQAFRGEPAVMAHRTVSTQLEVACGIRNVLDTPCASVNINQGLSIGFEYRLEGQQGVPVTLEKYIST